MRSIIVSTGLMLVTLLLTVSKADGQGQPPPVEWERVYGGHGYDSVTVIRQAADGGYFVAGETSSDVSGNKTSPGFGGNDSWLIRLDANGYPLWERTFGTMLEEYPRSLVTTADGGCLLGGILSWNPQVGDATNATQSGDYWIVRLNGQGETLWERSFGGIKYDYLSSMDSTPGGGYVLAGNSHSGISPDKSMTNFGVADLWIVWLDSQGNRLWDRVYGGTNYDGNPIIKRTSDGGFIVGAMTDSGPSGNKTSPNYGDLDFWVLRLDATGDIVWERTFGGLGTDFFSTLCKTRDDGCVVAGWSRSDIGGTKTSPNHGGDDYWVIRLDRLGNVVWERSLGGEQYDLAWSVVETWDGGFLVGGDSFSPPSGTKLSPYFGGLDAWIVRLDALGNELWQQSFGGDSVEQRPRVGLAKDGSYIVACASFSGVSGNRTVPDFYLGDIWILKLRPDVVNLRSVSSPADLLANDGYRFLLSGPTNTYVVEASSNLFAWQAMQTNQLETNSMVIHDSTASPRDRRFYRARVATE